MKTTLLEQIKSPSIPNFSLFKSPEAFAALPELLDELLNQEQANFQNLLKKKKESLTFQLLFPSSHLEYLRNLINHINQVDANEQIRKIISDFRPKYEDFANEIAYSQPYFLLLQRATQNLQLDDDQKRILELEIRDYKLRGIDLDAQKQAQLKELNKQLSQVAEQFQNNVVDDQAAFSYHFASDEALQEMPADLLEKMKKLTVDGEGYAVNADPTLLQAILKYCNDPQIRKTFYHQMLQRASKGAFDNRGLALQLLQLSHQKSHLMGYKNAAEMYLAKTMAQTPDQVFDFIQKIAPQAKEKAKADLQMLQEYFQLEQLDPRDIAYYLRKYKAEKFSLDEEKLKQYFEFEATLQWLHDFADRFFGVKLQAFEPDFSSSFDEKWYQVFKDGQMIGYYMLDAFYRPTKRPGARADHLRTVSETAPQIVLNVCNFQKNESGPTLLYRTDVETLFHEFGHALHALLADSKYPELSGFNIERDFIELPSQIMENRVNEPTSLLTLANHYQTGESLAPEVLKTLDQLSTFMMGYRVNRQNELGLLDISLYTHSAPDSIQQLDQNILETVNQLSLFSRGEEYKMYCSFLHIFGGGYAAKYYSYMRAELLEADAFQKIKKVGLFDEQVGRAFRESILAPGVRKPASQLFRDFMNREPDPQALMKKYGLL